MWTEVEVEAQTLEERKQYIQQQVQIRRAPVRLHHLGSGLAPFAELEGVEKGLVEDRRPRGLAQQTITKTLDIMIPNSSFNLKSQAQFPTLTWASTCKPISMPNLQ
jgi:hypothetical protein